MAGEPAGSGKGAAIVGLLTAAGALLVAVITLALGIAALAGAFGDKPDWVLAGICLVLGAVFLLTGVAGLSFAWRTRRG